MKYIRETQTFGAIPYDASRPFRTSSSNSRWLDWTLLLILILAAMASGSIAEMPAWLWMWLLAAALWAGFKIMNFRREGGSPAMTLLFFAWIGSDAHAFRYENRVRKRAGSHPDASGAGPYLAIALGVALVFGVLPIAEHPLAIGWLTLAAMLSLLHFGTFAIFATIWNRMGFPVEPIMKAPWAANSLAEFWGRRWNRAFSDWSRVWIFRALVRRFGASMGTLAAFFASGIAHELVISLPARAGFGLPTAYFLVQALGILIQREFATLRGRISTLAIVIIPAPALFHPAFLERVFVPMAGYWLQLTSA